MSKRIGVDLGGTTAKLGVVTEQNEESYYVIRVLLNDIPDREEISKGFTHLLAVDIDESIMYPVVAECAAVCSL